MAKINIPYLSIRLLTIFSYFLPFVFFLSTCTTPATVEEAYNKNEALINEEVKLATTLSEVDTLIKHIGTDSSNVDEYLSQIRSFVNQDQDNIGNLEKDTELLLVFPTDYSLSGIGTVYHFKNITGSIIVGISLFVSLVTLLFWNILNRKKIAIYVISLNLVTALLFVINCIISKVSILYGFWMLVFLLIVQLVTEIQKRKALKKEEELN